jgi:hypothetical protein
MQWEGLLIQVIYIMIATFVPVLGIALKNWIARQSTLANFMAKEELVATGVEFVQQMYSEYDGAAKYNMALDWISEQLKTKNINVDTSELKGLIESAVYRMKIGWNK